MILVRYGELAIKSEPVRRRMESILVQNIKDCLKRNKIKFKSVKKVRGRILADAKKADVLKNIFGIVSFSHAIETKADLNTIKKNSEPLVKGTFRVTARRLTKDFPLTSLEIEKEVGAHFVKKGFKVSLKKFKTELFIEIYKNRAFLFTKKIKGPGGLPLGSSGKMIAIVKNNNDITAAKLMMKRGVQIIVIGKKEYAKKLQDYDYGRRTKVISESEDLFLKAESLCKELKCLGIISGLDVKKNLNVVKELHKKIGYPIYYPLFGYTTMVSCKA